MNVRCTIATLIITAMAGHATAQDISGNPQIVDGKTMIVAGQTVTLADINTPDLGEPCIWNNQPLDCGVLARAGLMDLTAGAIVSCKPAPSGGHRCTAAGYDLAYGMIHAGWAVAHDNAPDTYRAKMQNSEESKRALWSATTADQSEIFALTLKR